MLLASLPSPELPRIVSYGAGTSQIGDQELGSLRRELDARASRVLRLGLDAVRGDRKPPGSVIHAFAEGVARPSKTAEAETALRLLAGRTLTRLPDQLVAVIDKVETRPADLVLAWAARHAQLDLATQLVRAALHRACLVVAGMLESWSVLPDCDEAIAVHWGDEAYIAVTGTCTCGGSSCGRPDLHDLQGYLEVGTHVSPKRRSRRLFLGSWLERACFGWSPPLDPKHMNYFTRGILAGIEPHLSVRRVALQSCEEGCVDPDGSPKTVRKGSRCAGCGIVPANKAVLLRPGIVGDRGWVRERFVACRGDNTHHYSVLERRCPSCGKDNPFKVDPRSRARIEDERSPGRSVCPKCVRHRGVHLAECACGKFQEVNGINTAFAYSDLEGLDVSLDRRPEIPDSSSVDDDASDDLGFSPDAAHRLYRLRHGEPGTVRRAAKKLTTALCRVVPTWRRRRGLAGPASGRDISGVRETLADLMASLELERGAGLLEEDDEGDELLKAEVERVLALARHSHKGRNPSRPEEY